MALVAFAAVLSSALGGCLSNEYVIPRSELARLATLPPEQRGQRVQVVQDIGDRRGPAVDGSQPPPAAAGQDPNAGPPPEGYVEQGGGPAVGVFIAPPPPIIIGPPLPGPLLPGPHIHGAPGFAPGRGPPVAPTRAAPQVRSFSKGGGGSKEDVVVFLVVVAVLAAIGMIATEGSRFDGYVSMYAWQPIHLVDTNGAEREIPLAELTEADVATATQAKVMDDEGWGMQRLDRRPLDRQGFAFKLNMGVLHAATAALSADAFGANFQLGYFPHSMVGLVASLSLSAGADNNGDSFYRNTIAAELQVMPIALYRLHLGGFGHVGKQYADDVLAGTRTGTSVGGGVMIEIDLTTRLALTLRGDYTAANLGGDGWTATQMYTFGVAIY